MENNFITLAYAMSYPGILALTWIITNFLKKIVDKLNPENKTKYVVLGVVILLSTIRTLMLAMQLEVYDFMSVLTVIVEWLLNIPILWFAAMKAYEERVASKTIS